MPSRDADGVKFLNYAEFENWHKVWMCDDKNLVDEFLASQPNILKAEGEAREVEILKVMNNPNLRKSFEVDIEEWARAYQIHSDVSTESHESRESKLEEIEKLKSEKKPPGVHPMVWYVTQKRIANNIGGNAEDLLINKDTPIPDKLTKTAKKIFKNLQKDTKYFLKDEIPVVEEYDDDIEKNNGFDQDSRKPSLSRWKSRVLLK